MEATKANRNKSIYVAGYLTTTTKAELQQYFSQFGDIVSCHFRSHFAYLEFNDVSIAEKVVNMEHILDKRKLVVQYKKEYFRGSSIEDESNLIIYQEIIEELKNLDDFEQEFLCMVRRLQPHIQDSYEKYNEICRHLYVCLHKIYPYLQVYPFGSTLTGLGFNDSDVDIFLLNVKWKDDEDDVKYLKIIKSVLNTSALFFDCFVIVGAKTPIIKCIHSTTKLRCDINVKNMLGVCNSKLIHYYLSLDLKIRKAAIILKYWGKSHRLTGQNCKLSNYALTMLLIFFLQQSYKCPAVLDLQSPRSANMQGPWNGGFEPKNFVLDEKLTLLQIVEDFFHFYSTYDYQENIICPYLGRSLPRTYFESLSDWPTYFRSYEQYLKTVKISVLGSERLICVQDPFEHCRNVAGSMSKENFEKFLSFCKLSKSVCASKQQVLYTLLLNNQEAKLEPLKMDETIWEIFLKHKPMEETEDSFKFVTGFVETILKDVLRFNLKLSKESLIKNRKNEGQTDIHDTQSVCMNCSSTLTTWVSRKAIWKQIEATSSAETVLQKEIETTDRMVKMSKDQPEKVLEMRLVLTKKSEDEVIVRLEKTRAHKKSFNFFARFFSVKLTTWFDAYEKEAKIVT